MGWCRGMACSPRVGCRGLQRLACRSEGVAPAHSLRSRHGRDVVHGSRIAALLQSSCGHTLDHSSPSRRVFLPRSSLHCQTALERGPQSFTLSPPGRQPMRGPSGHACCLPLLKPWKRTAAHDLQEPSIRTMASCLAIGVGFATRRHPSLPHHGGTPGKEMCALRPAPG
jgi:hypothetical protein